MFTHAYGIFWNIAFIVQAHLFFIAVALFYQHEIPISAHKGRKYHNVILHCKHIVKLMVILHYGSH